MILADTSIWITYFRNNDADLKDVFNAYLKKNDVYTVSAVFGELFQGAKNNRDREMIQGFWENVPKVKEDMLFITAGLNSNKYKLLTKEWAWLIAIF